MPFLRYDLRTAYESGATEHPQAVMRQLGYTVTKFEGVPIGDCAILEVSKLITPLEDYLTEIEDYEFDN